MRLGWCVLGVALVPAAVAVADAHIGAPPARLALPPPITVAPPPAPTLPMPAKRALAAAPRVSRDDACAACGARPAVAPPDRTDPWTGQPIPMPAAPVADTQDPWTGQPMVVARRSVLALDTGDPWN